MRRVATSLCARVARRAPALQLASSALSNSATAAAVSSARTEFVSHVHARSMATAAAAASSESGSASSKAEQRRARRQAQRVAEQQVPRRDRQARDKERARQAHEDAKDAQHHTFAALASAGWASRALRTRVGVDRFGLTISPQKLNDMARPLRGLSVDEALIQCKMHRSYKAMWLGMAIWSARTAAVNNFNCDASRLIVDEIWVGKGSHLKRMLPRAKGSGHRIYKYRSNLKVWVREVPYQPTERRLGRVGRTNSAISRTLARLAKMGKRSPAWSDSLPHNRGDATTVFAPVGGHLAGRPPISLKKEEAAAPKKDDVNDG